MQEAMIFVSFLFVFVLVFFLFLCSNKGFFAVYKKVGASFFGDEPYMKFNIICAVAQSITCGRRLYNSVVYTSDLDCVFDVNLDFRFMPCRSPRRRKGNSMPMKLRSLWRVHCCVRPYLNINLIRALVLHCMCLYLTSFAITKNEIIAHGISKNAVSL